MDQFSFTKISYTGNTNITNSHEYRIILYVPYSLTEQKSARNIPEGKNGDIFGIIISPFFFSMASIVPPPIFGHFFACNEHCGARKI